MQDKWYADDQDLIKWAILLRLADQTEAARILQLAFYRQCTFNRISINEQEYDIPVEVTSHFRNLRKIGGLQSKTRISLYDADCHSRTKYIEAAIAYLRAFEREKCIVLLDPDTGIAPLRAKQGHIRIDEVVTIWKAMKLGDVLAIYQHLNGKRAILQAKKHQLLAHALGINEDDLGIGRVCKGATCKSVIFFIEKKHKYLLVRKSDSCFNTQVPS
jgi:hypothetical protein